MCPASSMIRSDDRGMSSLRRVASAGGVSRSRLPHRMSVGTLRRVTCSVRSMALAARTSFSTVSARQARSSCIPRLTAPAGAPGANKSFCAIEK